MEKIEFLNAIRVIEHDIFHGNSDSIDYHTIEGINQYVARHPHDEDVIAYRRRLYLEFQKPFLGAKFKYALDGSSMPEYQRLLEVIKNAPFMDNYARIANYFKSIIPLYRYRSNYLRDFYPELFEFAKQEGMLYVDENTIKLVNDFIKNHECLVPPQKFDYGSPEVELARYKNGCRGRFDHADFERYAQHFDDYDPYYFKDEQESFAEKYLNKKLGNVSEIFMSSILYGNPNYSFVARDIGDGFGYDMYYQNIGYEGIVENLCEVKGTRNSIDNKEDYFHLSDTEYATMIDTLIKENVNYYIYRVYYNDNTDYNYLYDILTYRSNGCIYSDLTGNLYEYDGKDDGKHYFKKKIR